MGFGSDTAGLLFRVRADTSEADAELKKFAGKMTGVSSEGIEAFSALGESAGPMGAAIAGAAVIATVALTATVAVTVALTEKLYDLAKSASESGSKIHDAAQQAGIGAETMAGLGIAADQSGSSLEKIAASVAKFDTLLGQADNGNKKAEATLKQYGITADDTEKALAQAVRTIALMSDTSQQAAAAAALFKDKTGEILPVIKSFDGDLPALMKKLRDLGVILSQDDYDAADKFGDQIDTLNLQLRTISDVIGTAVMPAFSQFFSSLSSWLANNQSEIAAWAGTVGSSLNRVMIELRSFVTGAQSAAKIAADIQGGRFLDAAADLAEDQQNTAFFNNLRANNGTTAMGGIGASVRSRGGGGGKGGGGGGGRGGARADTSAQDDLRAQIDLQKLALSEYEKTYKDTMKRIREEFKKTQDDGAFNDAAADAQAKYIENLRTVLDLLDKLERQQLKSPTPNQSKLLTAQQAKRRDTLGVNQADDVERNNELIEASDKKLAEARIKIAQDLTKTLRDIDDQRNRIFVENLTDEYQAIIDNESETNEVRLQAQVDLNAFLVEQAEFDKDRKLSILEEETDAQKKQIQETVKDEIQKNKLLEELEKLHKSRLLLTEDEYQQQLKDIQEKHGTVDVKGKTPKFNNQSDAIGALLDRFKDNGAATAVISSLADAFQQLGQAVGQTVEALVLYGNAGGNLRQVTARILAAVASQAAVKAVYELAEGLACLALAFFGDADAAAAAPFHFGAAAMYGAIAGVAGIAGRAVAGDSFKKQSSTATGSGSGASGPNFNDPNDPNNNFRSPFKGYQTQQAMAADRQNTINGALFDVITKLDNKITSMSPGDVVAIGAGDAGSAINASLQDHLSGSLVSGNQTQRHIGLRP